MAEPFIAEIKIFAGNFAPRGYATCDGQLMPISQNTALFSLVGTFYGGNGTSSFGLPDLRGRTPISQGQGPALTERVLGEEGGIASVQLIPGEMPQHNHGLRASSGSSGVASPSNGVWAVAGSRRATVNLYTATSGSAPVMNPAALSVAGSSLPHNNLSPYLVLTFIIALEGVFPTRN